MRIKSVTGLAAMFAVAFLLYVPAQAATCESLATLSLKDAKITAAESVASGAFVQAGAAPAKGKGGGGNAFGDLPAFCRVAATLTPSTDSDIKMELWLPVTASWNGNYQAFGNGAWQGSITPATIAGGVRDGYASAMTDTGHEGGSASFALGHPEKQIDFGYRAVHEMTVKSKAILAAFYGRGPKYSYWNGCSAGGKQGTKEAQMFPEDYDGILAGAPVLNWTGRAIQGVWIAQAVHNEEGSLIAPAKFPAIHAAVIAACDALDGVKDGVIENPSRCKFDPQVLACKDADAPTCLTAPQVEAVRKIMNPAANSKTKEEFYWGLMPGTEMGWGTFAGAQPFGPAVDEFKYVVFQDANWDYKTFNFDTDVAKAIKTDHGTMDALDPNLKPFFARGGKLLQYQGWADPQNPPMNPVNYYKSVAKTMGGDSKVQDNYRLFMVPGMGHCQGGEGTDQFDKLGALKDWVENKKAPNQIVASRVVNGQTVRTRPLCPYPQEAVYNGTGSTDEAASFSCKAK